MNVTKKQMNLMAAIITLIAAVIGLFQCADNNTTVNNLDHSPTISGNTNSQIYTGDVTQNYTINPEKTKAVQSSKASNEDVTSESEVSYGAKLLTSTLPDNTGQKEIAILIVDDNNNIVDQVISEIARLYSEKQYKVYTSLFSRAMYSGNYVTDLYNGILPQNVNLYKHIDYICVGKITSSFGKGSLSKGYTTNASCTLDLRIISAKDGSMVKSPGPLTDGAPGDTKENALNEAIRNLLTRIDIQKILP